MNLPTIADLETAVETVERLDLEKLLSDRLGDTIRCELQDLTHVLVVEAHVLHDRAGEPPRGVFGLDERHDPEDSEGRPRDPRPGS